MALVSFVPVSFGQRIFFPKADYADSASLTKAMPLLAMRVLAEYKEADTANFYIMFRLQLLAHEYAAAEKTFDIYSTFVEPDSSLRNMIEFSYVTYSRARTICEQNKGASFNDMYDNVFVKSYHLLSESARSNLQWDFMYDLAVFRKQLDDKLVEARNVQGDSIPLEDAIALCRNYCRWLVCSTTGGLANKLLVKLENEDYISDDSVIVKMPDGGTVSMTVIRKRNITVPQPVLLQYTIYPGIDHATAKEFAEGGYVGIVANTRGKRLSQNDIEPFEHDARDAYSIIDWISKQPWCNGKVGMYGGSYLGFAQWSATKYLHPALKTIVPQAAVGAGIDFPMQNNIFRTYMLRWIHYVGNNKYTDKAEFSNLEKWDSVFAYWYKSGRSFRSLDTLEGRPNAIFQRWLTHPSYDSYWKNMIPQEDEFSKINIPVLTMTGYWDDDQRGAINYFKQHHESNKNANHYLLIGPYDHGGSQGHPKKDLLGYTIDSVANIPTWDIAFKWFDHFLKDSTMPAMLSDKVNYEVVGANEWKHVPSLDKMNDDTLTFYLGNTFKENYYELLSSKPSMRKFIKEEVDFKDRRVIEATGTDIETFPLLVDSVLHPGTKMVFMSEPLQQNITLSGALRASMTVAINKKDFDLVLDLYAQMPDGKYLALNENVQRASYAIDKSTRHLLQPDKIQTVEIKNTYITCIQLQKGSRIVVLIGVNNNPTCQVNYGTGKEVSDEDIKDATIPLQIKWYNASTIKIPIWK